jgi:RNA polymerase sigma-70 factor (ECF subfamily)
VNDLQRRVAFELVFREHAAAVRAYARRRIDDAAADDVVSQVFVIAWRRLDELPDDPLPWLYGCARRVLANERRGARRQEAVAARLAEFCVPASPVNVAEDRGSTLRRALASLRDSDRELLMLVAWEGLDPGQAAQALGCSRATLAVRLHRARRRLREATTQLAEADQTPSIIEVT